jgi:hypothetical protein
VLAAAAEEFSPVAGVLAAPEAKVDMVAVLVVVVVEPSTSVPVVSAALAVAGVGKPTLLAVVVDGALLVVAPTSTLMAVPALVEKQLLLTDTALRETVAAPRTARFRNQQRQTCKLITTYSTPLTEHTSV